MIIQKLGTPFFEKELKDMLKFNVRMQIKKVMIKKNVF